MPRQQVNYHLRTLERHGLVELVSERRKGNMTERLMRATAASYVISPTALAAVQPDPERAPDRLSAFSVHHHEEPLVNRRSEKDVSLFIIRMTRVVYNARERIRKHGERFAKRYFVFG